jgi:predicted ATPase
MIHLKSLTLRKQEKGNSHFPFNVPVIQHLKEIQFTAPVTFLVGENGSGKSTLLEAIACAAGSITVGSESVKTDKSLVEIRKLAAQLRLSWSKRTHKGFFLRAEDFFGYAKNLTRMRQELEQDIESVDETYEGRSKLAVELAKSPHRNELHALKSRYGENGLDAHSHGESFLTLFQSRFVPGGLYLLDEPEAPLSPMRQLAFLSALKRMVGEDSQFIITTHSPILMAFQPAVILSFDHAAIQQVQYNDLEHVKLTRAFLNDPLAYLNHL